MRTPAAADEEKIAKSTCVSLSLTQSVDFVYTLKYGSPWAPVFFDKVSSSIPIGMTGALLSVFNFSENGSNISDGFLHFHKILGIDPSVTVKVKSFGGNIIFGRYVRHVFLE